MNGLEGFGIGQGYEFVTDTAPWWGEPIDRSLDILGARYGHGDYVSPDNPRYRQGQYGGGSSTQNQSQYGFSPGGVTGQGFQINWWTAALLGIVVGAFLLGKKR